MNVSGCQLRIGPAVKNFNIYISVLKNRWLDCRACCGKIKMSKISKLKNLKGQLITKRCHKVEAYDKIVSLFKDVKVYGNKWIVLDCRPQVDLISVSTQVPFYSGEIICRIQNVVSGEPLNGSDLDNAKAISKIPDLLKIIRSQ